MKEVHLFFRKHIKLHSRKWPRRQSNISQYMWFRSLQEKHPSLNIAGLQDVLFPILPLVFFSTCIFYYLLIVSDSFRIKKSHILWFSIKRTILFFFSFPPFFKGLNRFCFYFLFLETNSRLGENFNNTKCKNKIQGIYNPHSKDKIYLLLPYFLWLIIYSACIKRLHKNFYIFLTFLQTQFKNCMSP